MPQTTLRTTHTSMPGSSQLFTMKQVNEMMAVQTGVIQRLETEIRQLKVQLVQANSERQPSIRQGSRYYRTESQQALACPGCGYISCRCGVPEKPSLDTILKLQAQRRGV
jgi:hypothetical protein